MRGGEPRPTAHRKPLHRIRSDDNLLLLMHVGVSMQWDYPSPDCPENEGSPGNVANRALHSRYLIPTS